MATASIQLRIGFSDRINYNNTRCRVRMLLLNIVVCAVQTRWAMLRYALVTTKLLSAVEWKVWASSIFSQYRSTPLNSSQHCVQLLWTCRVYNVERCWVNMLRAIACSLCLPHFRASVLCLIVIVMSSSYFNLWRCYIWQICWMYQILVKKVNWEHLKTFPSDPRLWSAVRLMVINLHRCLHWV